MRLLRYILILVAVPGVFGQRARAQEILPATEYVTWTAEARPVTAAPGDSFMIAVRARIDDGWKMYALDSPSPTFGVRFEWSDLPPGIGRAGEMRQTEPTSTFDPYIEVEVRYFTETAGFTAPFRVSPDADEGVREISGTARFTICNARLCLPPAPVELSAALTVGESAAESAPPDFTSGGRALPLAGSSSVRSTPDEATSTAVQGTGAYASEGRPSADVPNLITGPSDFDRARSAGLWGFLLLAVGAGLAALLTPCVFPMIPLTVSYFTKHSADRAESIRMACVYGAAIVITFTSLGVLTALFVGAAGAQTIAANPWINLFIGAVFIVFALSLLGLFELRLPNALLNYFNRQSETQKGYLGVVFMGLTLTIVSFSCTAPFVGGLLAATVSDEWAFPIIGMLVFSATFSLPFVLFALFPKALHALPRSGAWMNTFKVVLGFVELAAALKFLSNADLIWGSGLLTRPVAIAASVVIFGLTGFYLLGKIRLRHEPPIQSIGVARLLSSVAFLGLALYMLPGLFGAPLNALDAYLPPRRATDVSLLSSGVSGAARSHLSWHDNIEAAYAAARAEKKPIFIDFTGYTCTNCRQMEANVFPLERIAGRLENDFVLLRLYTDDREKGPGLQRFQLGLTGTVALPTYAIVDPVDEELIARKTGIAGSDEFAAFLERGANLFRNDALAIRSD